MKPYQTLIVLIVGAFLFRLVVAQGVAHPGIGDPNHYYNLGLRLHEGSGFTIDYIWHFNHLHPDIVHPDDHWMPLAAVLAAVGMSVFGPTTAGALLPFILLGTLLCAVAYYAARQFGCGQAASLFAAAVAAVLPEFVLNSVRTDTTIPNAVFVCLSILLLTHGLKTERPLPFAASGLMAGLAYLTRNDSILLLPMLAVTLVVYWRWGPLRRWYYALLVPLVAVLIAAPWLIRNMQTLGYITPAETQRMYFFADQRDHYAYQRDFSLQTLLAQQTPGQLLGKRLFELAAAAKIMYTTLDVFLPIALFGGLLLLAAARDRERWLILAPPLILLAGALVFYPFLVPYKSQSGSFKKVYLSLIPLLIPLAAYALERAVANPRMRAATMIIALGVMGANAFELVRADARFTASYMDYIRVVVDTARALPDANDDGQLILMAQDPFMLRFFGVSSIMIPMESREKVLEAAQRYRVDYLMMPPDRPSLDALYTGAETDPRFELAARITGANTALYRLNDEQAAP